MGKHVSPHVEQVAFPAASSYHFEFAGRSAAGCIR
jgi:hypothetical protein